MRALTPEEKELIVNTHSFTPQQLQGSEVMIVTVKSRGKYGHKSI